MSISRGVRNVNANVTVQSGSVNPVVPADKIIYVPEILMNGSNASMNVDGSSVNVEFEWAVPASETWYVDQMKLIIIDAGSTDKDDFGAIAGGITNGLLIEVKANGSVYTYANVKTNIEIAHHFDGDLVSQGEDGTGFLDEDDLYLGIRTFNPPFTLTGSTGDFVKATVRDNLTALDELCISIDKWRTI